MYNNILPLNETYFVIFSLIAFFGKRKHILESFGKFTHLNILHDILILKKKTICMIYNKKTLKDNSTHILQNHYLHFPFSYIRVSSFFLKHNFFSFVPLLKHNLISLKFNFTGYNK